MRFALHYRGPLKANRGPTDKQAIRRHFHSQLRELWQQVPLSRFSELTTQEPNKLGLSVCRNYHGFTFAPLVSSKIALVASLDVLMLKPEPPGSIITQGGDIDNRIKTLLDALKVPSEPNAVPAGDMPLEGERPFYCLLEDDHLVTSLSVRTDRLLEPVASASEVDLVVHVETTQLEVFFGTIGLH